MTAPRRPGVDDEDLQDYIYGTIRRLERLAKRLETYAEEQNDATEGTGTIQRGRSTPEHG